MDDAQVVYERNDAFDMHTGPYGYERVGFRIGRRVFWVGCTGSYQPSRSFEDDVKLANEVVERWNAARTA